MENISNKLIAKEYFNNIQIFFRQCLFRVLSFGPMPHHIAFILDGNRRYGRKHNLSLRDLYYAGFYNLLSILRYCYEMGIGYVTVFAFSIDNLKRSPIEVQLLMDLIHENINELAQNGSTLNQLGIRVKILGNLELMDESIREAADKVMATTINNSKLVLLVCIAYTSSHEIVQGVQVSCQERRDEGSVSLVDLEKNMYFSGCPDPDVLIRTSGETRLSNFLLWQTRGCLLYAPRCLWPEISLRDLVWACMLYQRKHAYLEKAKDQIEKLNKF